MPATLTAAQSQYLSQLTQQAQSSQVQSSQSHYAAVSNPSAPAYTTGTEFVNSYSTTLNDIGNTQQVCIGCLLRKLTNDSSLELKGTLGLGLNPLI